MMFRYKNFSKNILWVQICFIILPAKVTVTTSKTNRKLMKVAGHTVIDEFKKACEKLPDNDNYLFVICDDTRNRNLPYLSYFFSVVLKYISDSLPDHPSTTALYKYFEDMFAPIHTVKTHRQSRYCELKSEKASDVNDVIEKVVEYALKEWGIEVPRQEDLKDPEMRELHSQAYLNQEVDWSNFISSRKLSKDERRNKKTERI